MKSTGMTRSIDQLGRIVIPKELRRTLDIEVGDPLEIFVDGEEVILRKYKPAGKAAMGNIKNRKAIKSSISGELKEKTSLRIS